MCPYSFKNFKISGMKLNHICRKEAKSLRFLSIIWFFFKHMNPQRRVLLLFLIIIILD